jgi:hypothetical protein
MCGWKWICSVCFHRNARRKVRLRIRHPADPLPIIADQLVRQFDSVWVFLISLVLFGKNLFQPLCLFLCNPRIHPCGIVAYEELFAAKITPESSHLLETCCLLSATLLYRHRYHLRSSSLGILNQATRLTLRSGEAIDVISAECEEAPVGEISPQDHPKTAPANELRACVCRSKFGWLPLASHVLRIRLQAAFQGEDVRMSASWLLTRVWGASVSGQILTCPSTSNTHGHD